MLRFSSAFLFSIGVPGYHQLSLYWHRMTFFPSRKPHVDYKIPPQPQRHSAGVDNSNFRWSLISLETGCFSLPFTLIKLCQSCTTFCLVIRLPVRLFLCCCYGKLGHEDILVSYKKPCPSCLLSTLSELVWFLVNLIIFQIDFGSCC